MIKGNKDLIEKARRSTPQDKNIYINYEVLEELPPQFEAVITAVKFDFSKLEEYFTNVGTEKKPSWMPTTEIMYQIADAKGISGGDDSKTESVFEEVDINPILCRDMQEAPTYRRIKVGEKVTKYSTVLEEDGTFRRSSPCTHVYNVFDRCKESWSKEEVATEGYSRCSSGKYTDGWGKQKNGVYYKNGYGKNVEPKYNTKFKRQSHLNSEMKFAFAKAETKAHCKTIRELSGMTTGYTTNDLKNGELLFAKIRKSENSLKLEQAANLKRISSGCDSSSEEIDLLFGEKNVSPKKDKTVVVELYDFISDNIEKVEDPLRTTAGQLLDWLGRTPDADKTEHWQRAVDTKIKMMEVIGD